MNSFMFYLCTSCELIYHCNYSTVHIYACQIIWVNYVCAYTPYFKQIDSCHVTRLYFSYILIKSNVAE